jgi:hypothetical protein
LSIDVVQLGANVGKSVSDIVYRLFEERPGLSGLFVEPHPTSFGKLKEYYSQYPNCFFEQAAIVPSHMMTYHDDSDTIPLYYRTDRPPHNSYEQANVLSSFRVGPKSAVATSVDVPCLDLHSLLKKYNLIGVEFELLQTDLEGLDLPLLLDINFEKILPRYIRAETVSTTTTAATNHLTQWGYEPLDVDPYYEIYKKDWHKDWPEAHFGGLEPAGYNTVWERKE